MTRFVLVPWFAAQKQHFLIYFANKFVKVASFFRFFKRLQYDVIVTSHEDGWYFLLSMNRGNQQLWIGSKYKCIGNLIQKTEREGCNTPSEDLRRMRVIIIYGALHKRPWIRIQCGSGIRIQKLLCFRTASIRIQAACCVA